MRRSVVRTLVVTAAALGMAAACGARDTGDLDFEFDPGTEGDGGAGATSGSGGRGAAAGTNGASGGGAVGRGGSFGSGGSGGAFGSGGASGRGGAFGSGGTFASGGTGGVGGVSGRGGAGGRGVSGRGGAGGRNPDAGVEDCTNSRDDDGDGLSDCGDPDCTAGFVCMPPAPDGWLGPVALWQGSEFPSSTLCSDSGYRQLWGRGASGIIAEPAECAACLCGSPERMVCSTARLSFGVPSTCGGLSQEQTISSNSCQAFQLELDARSVRWELSPPVGGTCQPELDGDSTVTPLRWSRHAAACESRRPGGGCGPGNTCMARPQAPFVDGTCIVQFGELTCPSPYVLRYLYHSEALDSRGCAPCSCSSPSGASCSGSVTVASDNGCIADQSALSTVGSCAALGADPTPPNPPARQSRSAIYTPGAASGGACSPSGGQALGSAVATNPITFCCSSVAGRFRLPPLKTRPADAGAD